MNNFLKLSELLDNNYSFKEYYIENYQLEFHLHSFNEIELLFINNSKFIEQISINDTECYNIFKIFDFYVAFNIVYVLDIIHNSNF